jgi:hypothetical protein
MKSMLVSIADLMAESELLSFRETSKTPTLFSLSSLTITERAQAPDFSRGVSEPVNEFNSPISDRIVWS